MKSGNKNLPRGGPPRRGRIKTRADPEPIFSVCGTAISKTTHSSASLTTAPTSIGVRSTKVTNLGTKSMRQLPKRKKKNVKNRFPIIVQAIDKADKSATSDSATITAVPVVNSKIMTTKDKDEAETKTPFTGKVKIGYNHYRDSFDCVDGRVEWKSIDEKFAISFVFHGNFSYWLTILGQDIFSPDHVQIQPSLLSPRAKGDCLYYFEGLSDHQEYMLQVQEDEVAGVGLVGITHNGPFIASIANGIQGTEPTRNPNRAFDDLTQELKGLSAEDLIAQTAEYQQLVEARDLEDILYSG